MAKAYFELLQMDSSKDSVYGALGISEERFKALRKEMLFMEDDEKPKRISDSMKYMIQFCESIEEVIWVSYDIGKSSCSDCPVQRLPMARGLESLISGGLDDNFLKFLNEKMKEIRKRMREDEE